MHLFYCSACKQRFGSSMTKLFVCPKCRAQDTVKRVSMRVPKLKSKKEKIDINKLDTLQNWGDITLVEDILSVVGSSLYKANPNDVDVTTKFTGLKPFEDAIKKVVLKKHLQTHFIKGASHGESLPKYDLVLKEKPLEKKASTNPPKYKYVRPIPFTKKMLNTEKFIVEPLIQEAQRATIIRKNGEVKIHLSEHKLLNNETFIKRVQMIEEPTDFVYEGYITKSSTIILTDIIEKDECNLRNDPLLSRKTFLIKSKIPRVANIAFIKFYYAKSKEEMLDRVAQRKSQGLGVILKPAFSKYREDAGWIKLDFKPLVKLDLGCGKRKAKGYFGIDKEQYEGVDKVYNLEKRIPLEDSSCKIVRANHFVEHHSNPQFIMEEIYRVLKHGGTTIIAVPESSTRGAQNHPDHKSFWNEFSIDYYTEPYLIKKFKTNCLFKIKKFVKRILMTNGIKRVHLVWVLEAIKDAE